MFGRTANSPPLVALRRSSAALAPLWADIGICPLAPIKSGPWRSRKVSGRRGLPRCEVVQID